MKVKGIYIGTNKEVNPPQGNMGQSEINMYTTSTQSIWMDTINGNHMRFVSAASNGGSIGFYANDVGPSQVATQALTLSATTITNHVNITLPTSYVAPSATTQLGGSATTTATTMGAASGGQNVLSNLSVTLGTGVWILEGRVLIQNASTTGTEFVSTCTGVWFNTSIDLPTTNPYTTSSSGVNWNHTGGTFREGGFYTNHTSMVLSVSSSGLVVNLCYYAGFNGVTTINALSYLTLTRLA
jgi:hypothetical protein